MKIENDKRVLDYIFGKTVNNIKYNFEVKEGNI